MVMCFPPPTRRWLAYARYSPGFQPVHANSLIVVSDLP
jgi:hypothetical protein